MVMRCLAALGILAMAQATLAMGDSLTIYATSAGTFDSVGPLGYPGTYIGDGYQVIGEISLASIPTDAIINTATMVNGVSAWGGSNDVTIYGYSGDGIAETADVNKGTYLGDVGSPTSPGYSLDVTAFINQLLSEHASFAGFDNRDSGNGIVNTGFPVLLVDYSLAPPSAPTPRAVWAGLWVLAGGALLVGGHKVHRRARAAV